MSPVPRFDDVATTVQRLSVLLAAGLPPLPAWRAVAASGESPVARDVVRGARGAHELVPSLRAVVAQLPAAERVPWSVLSAAWSVAEVSGAPLAPTLARLAETLRSLAQSTRDVEVALTGPIATARIVVALPPIGILFGLAIGADVLGVLIGSPAGWACLAIGSTLLAVAFFWMRRMVRSARSVEPAPGLALELTAIALGGGLSGSRARTLVLDALADAGLPSSALRLDAVLAFAGSAGVPAGALLTAEAAESRRAATSAAQQRAAALAVKLMIPLGVCVLPSFVALGVAPVLISLIASTATVI